MVQSLFQETACNDLVFSKLLCFSEISSCNHPCFRRSSYSHPFDEWPLFYYKRAVAAKSSFKFTIFFSEQEELWQRDIIVINYDTFLVSGRDKLKDSLLADDINCSNPFLLSVIIVLISRVLCLFYCTYCNYPL